MICPYPQEVIQLGMMDRKISKRKFLKQDQKPKENRSPAPAEVDLLMCQNINNSIFIFTFDLHVNRLPKKGIKCHLIDFEKDLIEGARKNRSKRCFLNGATQKSVS